MDKDTENKIKEIKRLLKLDMYDEFKDIDPYLILIAFTDKSYKWNDDINKKLRDNYNNQKNYEYLEFLGDKVFKSINAYIINQIIIKYNKGEKGNFIASELQSQIEKNTHQACLNLLNTKPFCHHMFIKNKTIIEGKKCSDNMESIIGMLFYHMDSKKKDFGNILQNILKWILKETKLKNLYNEIIKLFDELIQLNKFDELNIREQIIKRLENYCLNNLVNFDKYWKDKKDERFTKEIEKRKLIRPKTADSEVSWSVSSPTSSIISSLNIITPTPQFFKKKSKEILENLEKRKLQTLKNKQKLDKTLKRIKEQEKIQKKKEKKKLEKTLEKEELKKEREELKKQREELERERKELEKEREKLKKHVKNPNELRGKNKLDDIKKKLDKNKLDELKVQKEILETHLKVHPNELNSKNRLNEIIQEIQEITSSSSSAANLLEELDDDDLDDELLNFQGGGYIKYAHHRYKIRIGPKGGQYILRYGKKIYI